MISLRYRRRIPCTVSLAALGIACASTTPQARRTESAVAELAPMEVAMLGATLPAVAELAPMEVAMLGATLDTLVRRMRDSSSLCLTVLGGPAGPEAPSAAFLRRLSVRRAVVAMDRCPPTYTQMIAVVDSQGRPMPRPPAYIDPYRVEIGRPQFAGAGYAWIYARQLQGTKGRDYVCTAIWQSAAPRVICNIHREWIE